MFKKISNTHKSISRILNYRTFVQKINTSEISNVYHKEIPIGDFYNDFKKNNEQEFLDFEKILKNSNNRLKFS